MMCSEKLSLVRSKRKLFLFWGKENVGKTNRIILAEREKGNNKNFLDMEEKI